MDAHQIPDENAVQAAVSAERFLIFKHSTRCGISRNAFREYTRFIEANPDVPHGWVEVRAQRPLSNQIEAETGVEHTSPQVIWIVDGKPVWHTSQFDITAAALTSATG